MDITVADVLEEGRKVLEECGWYQGGMHGRDGSRCSMAATLEGQYRLEEKHELNNLPPLDTVADQYLSQVVGDVISRYNDAESTTKEDIILAFKQARELALQEGR